MHRHTLFCICITLFVILIYDTKAFSTMSRDYQLKIIWNLEVSNDECYPMFWSGFEHWPILIIFLFSMGKGIDVLLFFFLFTFFFYFLVILSDFFLNVQMSLSNDLYNQKYFKSKTNQVTNYLVIILLFLQSFCRKQFTEND